MKLDKKALFPMLLVFALFFLAIASLMLSGLSISRAISMQNEVIAVFMKSLQSSNALSAVADSGIFILQNAALPLLPFLAFSTLGFVAVLFFKIETKKLAVSLAAVAACALVAMLVLGQSPAFLIIALGYFALLLPIEFEERKTAFKTGFVFASSMLRYLNVAVAVAVLIALLIMPDFDKVAEQEMISSINILLPDMGELQQAQNEVAKTFVNQASSDVKNIIDNNYNVLSSDKQAQCSDFKNTVNSEIEDRRTQLLAQLQSGNTSVGTEQLAQEVFSKISIFSAMSKVLPLIAVVSLLFLLELLKPLLALLGGAAYSLAVKKTGR